MQYLSTKHALDVMHIERNISCNILKHMFGEKDMATVRRDMEAVGKFPHLHLREVAETQDWLQPKAPYVLTEQEKLDFLALICRTRVPLDIVQL
jgi:hypothetical protein